jgi:type II secretory pathway component PulM
MYLLIPIIVLLALLLYKGSSLIIKLTLLIVPFGILVAWFAHEGALQGTRNMGLSDMYAAFWIGVFLLCYETGILIHRWFLSHKGLNTREDNIFLAIGLVLLLASLIYFLLTFS